MKRAEEDGSLVAISTNNCCIPEHKFKPLYSAEPPIKEDPLKSWITLKRNVDNATISPRRWTQVSKAGTCAVMWAP